MIMVRKRFIAEGDLLPTGYRSLVKRYAFMFNIKGHIIYQPDESMEIVCEGTDRNIASFRKAIRIRDPISHPMGFYVRSLRQKKPPMDEKLGFFEIRYHRKMTWVEKEMDRIIDARMAMLSWFDHQDSLRARAVKKKAILKPPACSIV
jgi:acylphosphatase